MKVLSLLFCRLAGRFFFLRVDSRLCGVLTSRISTDAAALALLLAFRTTSARELEDMERLGDANSVGPSSDVSCAPFRTRARILALSATLVNVDKCLAVRLASGRGNLV
ncbi:MAG: hypothetical protein HC767_06405 [Akkermansiaceae bacterium]|nr:hypothetical protein [Akkermansiaceae bacterium]